jgi:hypothetical protein
MAVALLGGCGTGSAGDAAPASGGAGGAGQGAAASGGTGVAGGAGTTAGSSVLGGTGGTSGTGSTPAAGTGGAAGSAGSAGATGAGGSSTAGAGGAGNAAEPMRLAIAARSVPPGGEDHVCVVLALPNQQVAWLESIHATLTSGSHHLIVDRNPVGTPEQRQPTPCLPTMGGDNTRLIIAQQADTRVQMPPGTALRIEPRQPVFLQLHYINLGDQPADIEGVVELALFDDSAGTPIEAFSVFTGQTTIVLPAGEPGLAEFFLVPVPQPNRRVHVFALTSHTHSLGVESTIERVPDQFAPDATPLHRSLDWHEPPLTSFDPPLAFDGSDGLRLRCHYVNDTERDVTFGTAFEDEMCFMWMYYYDAP